LRVRALNGNLFECYQQLKVITEVQEGFELIKKVDEYRQYWRPDKVSVLLLAESHVFTGPSDFRCCLNLSGYRLAHYPSEYVRFIYCLAYGEPSLLNSSLQKKGGTPQFWEIFYGCLTWITDRAQFKPILGTTDFGERVRNKIRLLEDMKKRGIWLLDTSIIGLYGLVPKPSGEVLSKIIKPC
jgi:hypothetical protein